MSCRRAYDIDLAAYLADPRKHAHAEFRHHYPRCAACSAEVRAWSELEGLLRAPEEHPAPQKLLALEDQRQSLAPVERAALDEHLARCSSCRDELAALRAFEPRPAHAAAPSSTGFSLSALLAGTRRLLVQPAFAYALALLFAAPTLYRLVTAEAELLREAPDTPAAVEPRREDDGAVLRDLPAARRAQAPQEPPQNAPRAPAPERLRSLGYGADEAASVVEEEARADRAEVREVPLSELARQQNPGLGYVIDPASGHEPESKSIAGSGVRGLRAEKAAKRSDFDMKSEDVGEPLQEATPPRQPVLLAGPGGVHRLHVPLEPGMHEGELRVSLPGGRRMLTERFRDAADEVVIQIPSAWVTPGLWHIERHALGRSDTLQLQVP